MDKEAIGASTPTQPKTAVVAKLKQLAPHFFTPSVVENRNKTQTAAEPAEEERDWEPVSRKVSDNNIVHIGLHIDRRSNSYTMVCKRVNMRWLVSRQQLKDAAAAVKGSKWVRVRIGEDVLCLNRDELANALRKLEST